jgi:hypothetical protein
MIRFVRRMLVLRRKRRKLVERQVLLFLRHCEEALRLREIVKRQATPAGIDAAEMRVRRHYAAWRRWTDRSQRLLIGKPAFRPVEC